MTTCSLPRGRAAAPVLVILLLLLRAPSVSAQAEDQATARALFNEARALMKSGQYEQACPKLEAAARLHEGSGLLLNLGDCYEHVGRTASAWTEFGEAVSSAQRAGRSGDRDEALRRQTALEPKLSRLVIRVAEEAPGLLVKRDERALDRGAWGAAIPVDPGTHVVVAAAPGRAAWTGSVAVTQPGATVTLEVPALEETPTTAARPATPPVPAALPATDAGREPPAGYWSGRRVAGVITAGVGLAGLGVGGAIGLVAKAQYDTAKTASTGALRHDDSVGAASLGNVATVVVSVGAAVAAAGLVLWLTAPDAPVQVGTTGRGAVVHVQF